MVDSTVHVVFDPEMVVAAGLVIVLFAVMGYVSVRFLRKQPDFAEKSQMIWGATWFWAVVAGFIGAQQLVVCAGGAMTSYPGTIGYATNFIFPWGLILYSALLPVQPGGAFIGVIAFSVRVSKRPCDLLKRLERGRRNVRKLWYKLLMTGVLAVWAAVLLVFIAKLYGLERWILSAR
jgi:hypothetical protein